jgi:tetratricopeptide (TPR) repeat protein
MDQPLFDNKNPWLSRPSSNLRVAASLVMLTVTISAWPTFAQSNKAAEQKLPLTIQNTKPVVAHTAHSRSDILFKLLVAEIATTRNMQSIALNHYLQAAELSQDPTVAEQSTVLAISLQAPAIALSSAKLWATRDPKNLQAQLVATTLFIGQSVEAALPFLNCTLMLDPIQADQYLIEIQTHLSNVSAQNLKKALTLIATQQPNNPYVCLTASKSFAELGDIKNAHYWVDLALKLSPDLTQALELKTRLIRFDAKSYDPAIKFLSKQVKKFPNNKQLHFSYVVLLLENENVSEAKKELTQLIEDQNLGGQSLLLLGEIHLTENNLHEASNALKKALTFKDAKEGAQYLLAEITEREGKIQNAIQQYSAIESGPYHIPAVLRAVFLLKTNRAYQEGIYLLRNSAPTSIEEQKYILLTEVDLLNASKQSEDAMQLISDILTKLPNDIDTLFMHAITAIKLKSWEIAESDLKKILKQNPNNANALNSLGYVLSFDKKRSNEALNYVAQALALSPNNPAFMDSMGWAYYCTGNLQQALVYLKKANDLSDDGEIAAHLGEVLWISNHKNEAMLVWKKALEKYNDHEELLDTLKRLSVDLKH